MLLVANELGRSNCKGDAITVGGEANRASGAIIFPGFAKRSTIHSLKKKARPTALIRKKWTHRLLATRKQHSHHPV
jgi:hypothetical protein